jgi:hypothetical protein
MSLASGLCAADSSWYTRSGAPMADPATLYHSPLAGETAAQAAGQGLRLFSGYRLGNTWALEAGYLKLDPVARGALTGDAHDTGDGLNGVAVLGAARLPLDRNFNLTGRVGLTRWNGLEPAAPRSDRDLLLGTDVSYGAGGEYRLNDRFSLSADWDRYRLDERELDLFSAGVRYRFE